jgi:hypothetical protein
MRKSVPLTAAVCLALGLAGMAGAADEPQAIIAKAIKASGGTDKLNKYQGARAKSKGTLMIQGLKLPFTEEVVTQLPGKFKEVLDLDVMGNKISLTTVYNGENAWINANGKLQDLDDKVLTELKEAANLLRINHLPNLKDKKYEVTLVGEVKVNDRPAVGIKVATKGFRDANLYFYKDTGLLAKVERRMVDTMSGQEVTEERIVTEYQDVDGIKTAKKLKVLRDGKDFLDSEVVETKHEEKVDDGEFAKP